MANALVLRNCLKKAALHAVSEEAFIQSVFLARTDREGAFDFETANTNLNCLIVCSGYEVADVTLSAKLGNSIVMKEKGNGSICGKLRFGGKPVDTALVTALPLASADVNCDGCYVDSSGHFEVELPAGGLYRLHIELFGWLDGPTAVVTPLLTGPVRCSNAEVDLDLPAPGTGAVRFGVTPADSNGEFELGYQLVAEESEYEGTLHVLEDTSSSPPALCTIFAPSVGTSLFSVWRKGHESQSMSFKIGLDSQTIIDVGTIDLGSEDG